MQIVVHPPARDLLSDAQMRTACYEFFAEHAETLATLRLAAALHLATLHSFDLITAEDVRALMALVSLPPALAGPSQPLGPQTAMRTAPDPGSDHGPTTNGEFRRVTRQDKRFVKVVDVPTGAGAFSQDDAEASTSEYTDSPSEGEENGDGEAEPAIGAGLSALSPKRKATEDAGTPPQPRKKVGRPRKATTLNDHQTITRAPSSSQPEHSTSVLRRSARSA